MGSDLAQGPGQGPAVSETLGTSLHPSSVRYGTSLCLTPWELSKDRPAGALPLTPAFLLPEQV